MSADQPPAPTPNVSETPRTNAALVDSILCTEGGDEERTVYPCVEHVEADFARQLERELAAVTKERDTLRDWKESGLSVLNEINFQEIGKALGLGLGLSVPKNVLPGIRALRKQITAMTQARDALWIERCMVKGVVDAAGASENTLFGGVEKLGEQLAAVTKERDELKEDNDYRRTEMGNVWEMVQKISPWQESNDMNWSDEISCGLNGIAEQLTAALARAEKAEEDTRRLDWLEHDMIRLLQYSEPDSDGSDYQIEYFSRPGRKTVQSTSIRVAIDAALAPTKEPAP